MDNLTGSRRPPGRRRGTTRRPVTAGLLFSFLLGAFITLGPWAGQGLCEVSEEAKSLFRQAMELNRNRDYGTALDYFLKAYRLSPEILAQDDQGLLDNATDFLRNKAMQEPDSTDTHYQLAELLALRGIDEEALRHYRKVVELAPGQALAVLAQTEIDKIEKNMAATRAASSSGGGQSPAGGGPSTGGGPSNGGGASSGKLSKMKQRIQRLQRRIAELQKELERQKQILEEEREKNGKVKKELDELKVKAQRWKLYYTLYMNQLGSSYGSN